MRGLEVFMRWPWIAGVVLLLAAAAEARVVLVGIDGGSWNVVDPLLAAGELPNLAAIAREGVTADLETVEPVSSPVVWTSIATGRSPAAHGVTDFFSTALDVRVPSAFERLAARGLRVGLYDYLMTWPPATLEGGFVIPGWLRRDRAVTPPDVWARIPLTPWTNSYDALKTNEDYRQNALREVEVKASRWNALASAFDLDVGAVVYYAIDATSHRFWHGAYPAEFDEEIASLATGVERTALFDAWRALDRQLGEIRRELSEGDTILIASDHGFQARKKTGDVWVSHFDEAVARAGLDAERDGFSILSQFAQLVVRVRPGPFEAADRSSARLAELIESHRTPDGSGLFWAAEVLDIAPRPQGRERPWWNRLRQWAVKRILESVYDVELDPSAHALILAIPRAGLLAELPPDSEVEVGGKSVALERVFSRQVFTASHDPIGIFLAAGGPIARVPERGRISVLDVAPLLFYLAGSPLPDDLEGTLPAAWIDADRLAQRPVRVLPGSQMPGLERRSGEAPAGDPELVEKLRRLGYIE
jgi:predicted AlkP superfamily phosphohydrolase/phosphomutase